MEALFHDSSIVSDTVLAAFDSHVNFLCLLLPGMLSPHDVLHAILAVVSRQFQAMEEKEELEMNRLWHWSLYSYIVQGAFD